MHPNAELLQRFYAAFDRGDAEAMASCYAADIHFSDPVFPDLKAGEAGDMWRMLTEAAPELKVVVSGIEADDQQGKAHWTATYRFSQTGRDVVNEIDAAFTFRDGLIVRHVDTFDLYKWTRMALGPVGTLLGWSALVQKPLRRQAGEGLQQWRRDQGRATEGDAS